MSRLFLSYAAEDSQIARDLAARLRDIDLKGGVSVLDVESNRDIGLEVRQALRQSTVIVVLISERSIENQWVQFEMGAAFGMGKRIIPVLIGKRGPETRLPAVLQDLQYFDARERSIDDIVRHISHTLHEKTNVLELSIEMKDTPGGISNIFRVFANAEWGIQSLSAYIRDSGGTAILEIVSEPPDLNDISQTIEDLKNLNEVIDIIIKSKI